MNALALYGRYVATSLRAQAQYPAATLMLTAGHCAATAIEILGVFALFDRFGPVGGWSFGEAALFYALVNIMFSLADMLSRGFDVFGTDFVRTGAFDRVLLRPRAAALQLVGYEVRLSRLGRLLQGLVVLIFATSLAPIDWDRADDRDRGLGRGRRRGAVRRHPGAAGHARLLDRREPGDHERADLRRRPGGAVSAQHLRRAGSGRCSPSACRWPAWPTIRCWRS